MSRRFSGMTFGLGCFLGVLLVGGGCETLEPLSTLVSFDLDNPYAVPGTWFRGNFHMHSPHSDGFYSGKDLVDLYQRQGYGVICITDHNQWGDQDGGISSLYQTDSLLHDWNCDGTVHPDHVPGSGVEAYVRDWARAGPGWVKDPWVQPADPVPGQIPVVLPGAEVTHFDFHIGVIGYPIRWIEPPNAGTDYIPRTHAAGGFVYLAHPALLNSAPRWLAGKLPLRQFDGLEIMNGLKLSRSEPADATPLWDSLLTMGYRLWGLADDDAHLEVGSGDSYPFTAFDMLLTDDPSPQGFLEALRRGSFYASTGLLVARIEVVDDTLRVDVPDAERLRFIGRGGRVLLDAPGPRADYVVRGSEAYVRVEASAASDGEHPWPRSAWTQPFFVRRATGRRSGG